MTTKTKRVKKVFGSHANVAHIWAQQNFEEGRASDGRVFFEGDTIYSYGRHFKIAKFVKNDAGMECVLFNSHGYSVSTSKHQSLVRRAIHGQTVFTVPNLAPNHKENIDYYIAEINGYLEKSVRARKYGSELLAQAESTGYHLIDYIEFFGEAAKRFVTPEISTLLDRVRTGELLSTDERMKLVERRKKEEKAELERNKKEIEEWLSGERRFLTGRINKIFLRRKGDEVQTSWGANVPASEARLLYHAINKGMDVRGRTIGNFTVSSYNGKSLRIGCHNLDKSEIDRFAKSQNW